MCFILYPIDYVHVNPKLKHNPNYEDGSIFSSTIPMISNQPFQTTTAPVMAYRPVVPYPPISNLHKINCALDGYVASGDVTKAHYINTSPKQNVRFDQQRSVLENGGVVEAYERCRTPRHTPSTPSPISEECSSVSADRELNY